MRAEGRAGGVEVEVADSGEGIPAGDGERVFEAFYRGDASRGEDGAGLGLAISRAIVEAHGGRIWLEDATRARASASPSRRPEHASHSCSLWRHSDIRNSPRRR